MSVTHLSIRHDFRSFIFLSMLVCSMIPWMLSGNKLYAGDKQNLEPGKLSRTDSLKILRKKYHSKKTWEYAVSFPGTVVSFPLVLFLKSQEWLAGYIYEHDLVPRTKEFFTSADRRRGFMPKYSDRLGSGFKFYQKGLYNPESIITITATSTPWKRQRYRLEGEELRFFKQRLRADFVLRYTFLPDEEFYGLGPDTRESDPLSYDQEWINVGANFSIKTFDTVTLSAGMTFDNYNIFSGSGDEPSIKLVYNRATLPGLTTRVRIVQLLGGMIFDSRNRIENPSRGDLMIFSGAVFQEVGGGEYQFWKVSGDLSRFVHLFHHRTLVLRTAAEITNTFTNQRKIPFYYLSSLGHRESIRGYERGRFRDLNMFLGSVEYRIPIWHSTEVLFFVDAGQVTHDLIDDLAWNRMKVGYGGGVRMWNAGDFIATLQLGVSSERIRIYFNLN